MSKPWDGIPQDPTQSGWHWIGNADRMWPCEWWPITKTWGAPAIGIPSEKYAIFEYLGPCQPPATRCRDGSPRVAVSAEFRPELDQIYIRMNDDTGHYIDGYYWRDGKPVIDIVGKTIPQINAAADEYRRPKQEEPA